MRRRNRAVVGILAILTAAVICAALYLVYSQLLPVRRPKNRYQGTVSKYISSVDKDGDGVDDQTDILKGALAYVRKRPQYLSKYYADGYPDDGYGVCTDVVAAALRSAGYDLMELVQEDIRLFPGSYAVSEPDANIDFRRVENLSVYFSHQAISLTTDITDIEAWQGGDIVIFENHIGIISDRRNQNGVPYLIHHSGPMQTQYEEDILENRTDILGHYRVS